MLAAIQMTLIRDSVCMADDIDDHTKIIDIIPQDNICKTIMNIAEQYLPSVMGHGHMWVCLLDGIKVAVISGNCSTIKPLGRVRINLTHGCKLRFRYHSAAY